MAPLSLLYAGVTHTSVPALVTLRCVSVSLSRPWPRARPEERCLNEPQLLGKLVWSWVSSSSSGLNSSPPGRG